MNIPKCVNCKDLSLTQFKAITTHKPNICYSTLYTVFSIKSINYKGVETYFEIVYRFKMYAWKSDHFIDLIEADRPKCN